LSFITVVDIIVELWWILGEAWVCRWFSVSLEFTVDVHSAVSILRWTGEFVLPLLYFRRRSAVFCISVSNHSFSWFSC